jgi:hypothetical protein
MGSNTRGSLRLIRGNWRATRRRNGGADSSRRRYPNRRSHRVVVAVGDKFAWATAPSLTARALTARRNRARYRRGRLRSLGLRRSRASDRLRRPRLRATAAPTTSSTISARTLRERVKTPPKSEGIDVGVDNIGGALLFLTLARLMRENGQRIPMGLAGGEIPSLPMNLPFVEELLDCRGLRRRLVDEFS